MKRREFLASGVGAALWATGWPKGTRISRAHIRLGYAAITWGGNDARAIDDIAALGFRGIQLRQSAMTTWGDHPGELKQLLADRKLTLVALSSGDVSLDPAREHDILALHTRHARFVREVGGRYLQVIDQRPSGRDPTPDDFKRMGRLLTEIGRRSSSMHATATAALAAWCSPSRPSFIVGHRCCPVWIWTEAGRPNCRRRRCSRRSIVELSPASGRSRG